MLLLPQLLENPATKDCALQLITRLSSSSPGALETYVELSGIGVLITLLTGSTADVQVRSSDLFARFATVPQKRQELLNAECMPAVKTLIEQNTNEPARVNAIRGICAMSEDPIAQDVIVSSGIIVSLLKLLETSSNEIRGSIITILSRMSSIPEVMNKMATPEVILVFARSLNQLTDVNVVPSLIRLMTLIVRQKPDVCEIVERESLNPLLKTQLFIPENTSETMELLFEIITRRPDCSRTVLDPSNLKAVSLIFALVEPGGPLCQQAVAILYAVSVNCAEQFSAAVTNFSFDIEPFLTIASQQTSDQQSSNSMAMQALSVLSALSKNPKHRQLLAQSSLAGTLLTVLLSTQTAEAKAGALNFASELSGSESFRRKACESKVEWLRVFTSYVAADKPVAQVLQAEKALLRLSAIESVREQVSFESSELTRALAVVANSEDPERQQIAALAITVLSAFDLLDIPAYSAFVRNVFSRKVPCYEVKNALVQAIGAFGYKELFTIFAVPSQGSVVTEAGDGVPPPPPPPAHIDVDLLSLFCKGVADSMLHVGEMCPSFFHAAFGILYLLSRSDEARTQIRIDVPPENLGLFAEGVAGFAFDALRLADVVGSL